VGEGGGDWNRSLGGLSLIPSDWKGGFTGAEFDGACESVISKWHPTPTRKEMAMAELTKISRNLGIRFHTKRSAE